MNPPSLIASVLIALVGSFWLASQGDRIAALKEQADDLSLRLQKTRSPTGGTSRNLPVRNSALATRPIDWAFVAGEFRGGTHTHGFYRSTFGLEVQLDGLTAEELKQGLLDIKTGHWDTEGRLAMTRRILETLLEKDPGHLLLSPSDDPDLKGPWLALRNSALGAWTKKSPREAMQWFDSQPTESFIPRERLRLQSVFLGALAVSDFSEALERFEALPLERKTQLLNNHDTFGSSWRSKDFARHNLTYRFTEFLRRLPESRHRDLASPLTWLGEQERPSSIWNIQQNLEGWDRRRPGKLSMEVFHDYLAKIRPSARELDLCIDRVVEANCLHLPDQPERDSGELRRWLRTELEPRVRPE
jgi:hypothetical protein